MHLKKILTSLAAILYTTAAYALPVEVDGLYYNLDNENRTAEVTYFTPSEGMYPIKFVKGDVVIPSSIEIDGVTYTVDRIGESALCLQTEMTSVTIPSTVSTIGARAFVVCKALKTINLECQLTEIPDYCFYGCSSVETFAVPEGVTRIGDGAFSSMDALTSVTLPEGLEYIGDEAFRFNHKLVDINMPASVTHVGIAPFEYDYDLNVTLFSDKVFVHLANNHEGAYTIPSGIETIASQAFIYCHYLTSLTLPSSVRYADGGLYKGNTPISEPVYNEHLFYYMPNKRMESYTVPAGITTIAPAAFKDCAYIDKITIPESVRAIGLAAFSGCSSLTSIVKNNYIFAFMPRDYEGSYTLPTSIKVIGNYAFENCKNLTEIVLPDGLEEIDNYAFLRAGLTGTVKIPETVRRIGIMGLESAEMEEIDFGENPSLEEIDRWGVSCCRNLKSVTLPASLKTIGMQAFEGDENLAEINLPATLSYLPQECFSGSAVSSFTFPPLLESTGIYQLGGCQALEEVHFGENMKVIDEFCFTDCPSLRSLVIPEGVVKTGGWIFQGSENLEEVKLPSTLAEMGAGEFYECKSLKELVFPENIEIIWDRMCYNCTSLKKVVLPKKLRLIDYDAFSYCTALEELVIDNPVPPVTVREDITAIFIGVDMEKCTLYVPAEAISSYRNAPVWKDFFNIKPIEGSHTPVEIADTPEETHEYYTIDGRRVTHPSSGLYLDRSTSTLRKILK